MESVNHTERKHALLSASGATRWMTCTPSPRLEEGFSEKDSDFAKEGTLAHELAELLLRGSLNADIISELAPHFKIITDDDLYYEGMDDEVQIHVDYVLAQYTEANRRTKGGAILLIEEKVDLTSLIENGFGTCDVILICDGVLEVIDLKFGKGVRVSAENNAQLKLYGLGALIAYELSYDIHTVKLTITQPRLDSISTWELSAEDLRQWGEDEVKPKALLAYEGAGEQVPGDHCRFCKAKPRCRALHDVNMEAVKHDFQDPKLLNDDELVSVYKIADQVTDWLNGVSSFMLAEALSGKKWENYKVVEGRSNRAWTDQKAIEGVLTDSGFKPDQILTSKLQGIGAIEKLVGKTKFEPLLGAFVVKPRGKPALVPSTDKRPEFGSNSANADFGSDAPEDLS